MEWSRASKRSSFTLGKSTLLLTPEYGNWVNVGAVLTDLPLKSDPMLTESICIEGCSYCIDHCPTGAITQEGTVVQKLCRPYTYGEPGKVKCNLCRRMCPMALGKQK